MKCINLYCVFFLWLFCRIVCIVCLLLWLWLDCWVNSGWFCFFGGYELVCCCVICWVVVIVLVDGCLVVFWDCLCSICFVIVCIVVVVGWDLIWFWGVCRLIWWWCVFDWVWVVWWGDCCLLEWEYD